MPSNVDATDFIALIDEILFVLLFAATAVRAIRRPLRANLDTALLFGAVFGLVVVPRLADPLGLDDTPFETIVTFLLVGALPYLLIRLIDDFSDPPRWVAPLSLAFFVGLSIAIVVVGGSGPMPAWLLLINLLWFLIVGAYSGLAFGREALQSTGLTRRRMQAVALGSILLMSAIVVAFAGALVPLFDDSSGLVARALALGAALAYFLGFAPPTLLRRTWQEPELRAFLERAATLPRMPDTPTALAALEESVARAFGAARASIGVLDRERDRLRYRGIDGEYYETGTDEFLAGRSFSRGEAIFSQDAARDDPTNAEVYREFGVNALVAAPIRAGDERLGVLTVFSARPPIFAEDDLHLVRLLADQAAVILESRSLIDEAARVRAREEAARLKDDFLSAAAHDLRTPLTILLGQAELLERRATRDPEAPAELDRVERIAREARRLRTLVQDLLDASRVEDGQLVGNVEPIDLAVVAAEVCARHSSEDGTCLIEATGPVVGQYDRTRIEQLLDNLVENARKYSPAGAPVRVRAWREDGEARLAVSDQGIGIAPGDLPHIFERFYRGANVDDRRQAGMGLGLFICRGIVEQHGGRIWAETTPQGSTFHVALPATPAAAGAEAAPVSAELPSTPSAALGEQPLAHG